MTHLPRSVMAELQDKQIVVLGLGITGLSCIRFLHAHNIACSVNDSRIAPVDISEFKQKYADINISVGKWDRKLIAQADLLIVSPGIDLAQAEIADAMNERCLVWGDVELFCRINNATKQYPMLAVTGSNGKSTVVSLLAHLGEKLGLNVQLGGNIGQPVLDLLNPNCHRQPEGQNNNPALDMLIFELSSFQLETLNSMKAVAASVLNISDDHLDRHLTLANYQTIKQGIYQQSEVAVINRDDVATNNCSTSQPTISFGSDKPELGQFGLETSADSANNTIKLMFGEQALIALADLPLAGIHNGLNYLAVLALGYSAGWPLTEMVDNLVSFNGLAHRCQRVASNDDIYWINDSKATNVGATLAAISGLASTIQAPKKLILIAGGIGKGADFTPLKAEFIKHISYLITLGEDAEQLAQLVSDNNQLDVCTVTSIEQAVAAARKFANTGDTVMLSPACASFDMFTGFAARGDAFICAVQSYGSKNNTEAG